MNDYETISQMEPEDTITRPMLVSDIAEGRLLLTDGETEISALIFDREFKNKGIKKDSVADVTITLKATDEQKKYFVENISPCTDPEQSAKNYYIKFSDISIGTTFTRPVIIIDMTEKKDKSGNPYTELTICDGFSNVTARKFKTSADSLEKINVRKDGIARAKLTAGEFNGAKNFTCEDITALENDSPLTVNAFVRVPPVPLNVMYDEIYSVLKSLDKKLFGKYDSIAELTLKILEANKESYMTSSAAVSNHHNLKGGLLYHSYRMMKAADALCGVYTSLDRELMICGAVLHDIGKLWEYNTSILGGAEFTENGVLFGHLYMGASYIKESAKDGNYNKEKLRMLMHMIVSHHGNQEWGAVVFPATAEARMLHMIDDMDAKMYSFEDNYNLMEEGTVTKEKIKNLDTNIYKPSIMRKDILIP